MANLLSGVGDFISSAITWLKAFLYSIAGGTIGEGSSAVTYTASTVLIIFVVAVPLVGLGIGLLRRLIHTN